MPNFQAIQAIKSSSKTTLTVAISLTLAMPASQAATFNVTAAQDDGTGLISNTLSWAILQANTTAGDDVIELNTDVTITGVMKRLIDSNTTLQSDATRRTIDGNNQFRPLFIKSGQVTIQGLDIENGRAEGGGAGDGGDGAGLGGSIFIYGGYVSIDQASIQNSIAVGGNGSWFGGGGMFGNSSGSGGGGGLFSDGVSTSGGYGGYGNYQNGDTTFGRGGDSGYNQPGQNGGFGGGGGQGYYDDGGHGGFGGGGGYNYLGGGTSGDGGFGAGGGLGGDAGFGGFEKLAAGFGGAVFLRSGNLTIQNSVFQNNQALKTGSEPSQSKGLGGAIFVIHTTQNTNGNNQGMPQTLPTVSGCGITFNNNTSDTDPDSSNNNDDIFDLANRITPSNGVAITEPCGTPDQEIEITGNGIEIIDGDVTPETADGSDLGEAIQSSGSVSQTFIINNLGDFSLQLTGNELITLTDNNNGQFSITQLPDSTVAGNDATSFEVTFTPLNVGVDTATVVIANNDTDENPYDFVIQAEVLPASPEIEIFGNSNILDGDDTPSIDEGTDFGTVQESAQSLTRRYFVDNFGSGNLLLNGNPTIELQNNSGQFEVTLQPQFTVIPENSFVFFDVTFTPTSLGIDSTTVVIQNNDPDESPFDFLIQGEGIPQAPVLQVLGRGNEIENGDQSPSSFDNTWFGYTPVNGGQVDHYFELRNNGFANLNLSNVSLDQIGNHFSIIQNISDNELGPGESTFVGLRFDPEYPSFNVYTAVEVYDDQNNLLHFNTIEGFGQSTLTINSSNNYIQEGGVAEFSVNRDVFTPYDTSVNWIIGGGQVDANDFGGVLPSGTVTLPANVNQALIQVPTVQDGIFEGPELFNIQLNNTDQRINLGFPSVSGGVIDDDLIFVGGFEALNLNQVIAGISKYAFDSEDSPVCNLHACNFLNRSMAIEIESMEHGIDALIWFEETLILMQPKGDWDGDGLPNQHDLNPFGLDMHFLQKN